MSLKLRFNEQKIKELALRYSYPLEDKVINLIPAIQQKGYIEKTNYMTLHIGKHQEVLAMF